jgi:hypothetical protein
MHRSGTSLVVRLLADMGIHMGSWLTRDAESVHFLGLNKRIFQDADSNWGQVDPLVKAISSDVFIEHQVEIMQRALFNEKLSDFIKYFNPILKAEALRLALSDDMAFVKQNALIAVFFGRQLWESINQDKFTTWGWKDPRSTLTFPIWLRLFPNARFLHVVRNGIDVAISTHRRSQKQKRKVYKRLLPIDYSPNTLSFEYCFELWERHVAFVENHRYLIMPDRFLEIRYEDLLSDPFENLNRILTFIDHPINEALRLETCSQIDPSRLDNSVYARPYLEQIPDLAASPIMEQLGYNY